MSTTTNPYMVDLTKIKKKEEKTVPFVFEISELGDVKIKNRYDDDKVVAEYKNNDWIINGKSINAMWEALENHSEVLKILTSTVQH